MSLQNDIKIIFLGKCETGKTKLLNKWTRNEFNDEYNKTEISDLESKIYEKNKKIYRVQIWDISGRDEDATIAKIFIKESFGCLYISDATNKKTLDQ